MDEMDVSATQSQRENIRIIGLELSRSIASEKVLQKKCIKKVLKNYIRPYVK
ncbi:hypothetical protein Golax_021622 [Gossypium laxum]|uniref:Uncharacterized protein n=1 Tax=Gossypium laxum TaxID=34288 RepID=A0A7J9ANJ9_9ROSI|nr:hypothetical protein [Gossypium laxum]